MSLLQQVSLNVVPKNGRLHVYDSFGRELVGVTIESIENGPPTTKIKLLAPVNFHGSEEEMMRDIEEYNKPPQQILYY